MPVQSSHFFRNDNILTAQLTKGGGGKCIKSKWVVWLCFEGTEPQIKWECGENTRWGKSCQENGRRGRGRLGWSKITVTLSPDSTYYFSIRRALCLGDSVGHHWNTTSESIWQHEQRWSAGFIVPSSIWIIFRLCHHKSRRIIGYVLDVSCE